MKLVLQKNTHTIMMEMYLLTQISTVIKLILHMMRTEILSKLKAVKEKTLVPNMMRMEISHLL